MAGGSRQLEELKLLETGSCAMGGLDDSNSVTAPASDGDRATLSSSSLLVAQGESRMEKEKSKGFDVSTRSVEEQMELSKAHWSMLGKSTSIAEEQESDYVTAAVCAGESDDATESLPFLSALEEQIEKSKAHWSTLADQSGCVEAKEVAEVSNVKVFRALQRHPAWGGFFSTFGYELDGSRYVRMGELELGEKFAEGGQAELYNAHVTWQNPKNNEKDLRNGTEYVVKVLKKGTFLKHLQSQLPQGLLEFHNEEMEDLRSPTPHRFPRYICRVHRGILLKDGRFAFLMVKEHFDLRNLIERQMGSTSRKDCGPFSKEEAELIMYDVALGVNWLHSRGIVHRDLKASNVLVQELKSGWPKWKCYVADYECSVGVVGTRFFRAPEILQACKDGMASRKLEVFSRAADAYSFGMTCYEILTGKLPFEDYPCRVSILIDLIINQQLCPEVPKHVDNWARELLRMCWQSDPIARPSFGEILDLLSTHSTIVRRHEDQRIQMYGHNYRNWCYKESPNS